MVKLKVRARLCLVVALATAGLLAVLSGCGGSSSEGHSDQSNPQAALKSYDLAWVEGDANEACELLADQARQAVETEMSDRTVGGLSLNCPARMKEVLELLGPEAKAQGEELAKKVSDDKVAEKGDEALVSISPIVVMSLKKIGGAWYVEGSSVEEIEPFITREEVEEAEAEEVKETEEREQAESEVESVEASGTVNAEKQKRVITETLGTELNEPVGYVRCTVGVVAEPGARYACLAEMKSGQWYEIKYRITDAHGDLSELSQGKTVAPAATFAVDAVWHPRQRRSLRRLPDVAARCSLRSRGELLLDLNGRVDGRQRGPDRMFAARAVPLHRVEFAAGVDDLLATGS
jgi:hypothetical protein